jgi:outer membrane biogenesis lipoprotein LolB
VRKRCLPVSERPLAAVLLAALLAQACASARPVPIEGGPKPTPQELDESLRERDAAFASFQGQGRIDYNGPDGKVRSSNMVVVKAPDRVRIDFRSPFSLTYTVVSNGSELVAYDRGAKVLYRGAPTAENVGRYTRVRVDVAMLAALVRGLPPLSDPAGDGDVGRVPEGWRWERPLRRGGRLAIVFDPADLRPVSARLSGSRGADFSAYFEDYETVDGIAVAHRIRAELPNGGRVELSYGTIWRDREHTDAAFTLDAPAGVRVVNMDAG